MRIVYCLDSIRYIGGTERVTITKANALAELSGNEVYVVVMDDKGQRGNLVQPLSANVKLINLGFNYYEGDSGRSSIANLFVYARRRRQYRKLLYKTLLSLKPDVVISVGQNEKYMLLSMRKRSWKVIREFHFERNYRKKMASSKREKVFAGLLEFYDFSFKVKNYDKVVVLTEEDKNTNWKGWNNIAVIPNPVSFKSQEVSSVNDKTIISVGRLELSKNYSSLIRAFDIVRKTHRDWVLKIYGDGSQRMPLQRMIDSSNLNENIKLMGNTSDVIHVLKDASIFAFSSISEGFGLAIVESMECGVPVVSYQCQCGPKEIIDDGKDGFLVPVGDEKMMADRICTLIEDEELRRKMGTAAKEKAKKYHIENITKQWMALFEELVNK